MAPRMNTESGGAWHPEQLHTAMTSIQLLDDEWPKPLDEVVQGEPDAFAICFGSGA